MNDFVFHSPTKFVFRRGAADHVGSALVSLGFCKPLIAGLEKSKGRIFGAF